MVQRNKKKSIQKFFFEKIYPKHTFSSEKNIFLHVVKNVRIISL